VSGHADSAPRAWRQVRLTSLDGIATVTLDRPDALNAFTDVMEEELIQALDLCDADDEIRVVIITGAGRAFCAGMDIAGDGSVFRDWRGSPDAAPGTQHDVGAEMPLRRDGGGRVALRLFSLTKPVIAAINGHAVGVGITMTLAADIRIVANEAKIGFVFTRRGLVMESCSSWFLPRLVPMQTALEWVLTGRLIGAAEAVERGLCRSAHPAADVLPVATALAREIADHTAPVSVALSRQLMWRQLGVGHPMTAHEIETVALNLRGVSNDAAEGISAFLAKRAPVFTDLVSRDLPDVFSSLPAPLYRPSSPLQHAATANRRAGR
jgi:enoyl-CoA hydratase/carnithine racemase